jgi:hypothetical protein
MALSNNSVDKAWHLFQKMLKPTSFRINSFIEKFDNSNYDKSKLGFVFGEGPKYDDSWESIFIQLQNVTPEILQIWESGKAEIPNSSFKTEIGKGIIRFGFY